MPNEEIRILTSGDLTGIEAIRNGLIGIRDLATEISNQGIGINGTGYVPTPNQPSSSGINSNPMPQPYVFRNSPNSVPTPEQSSSFGSQSQGQGGFPTGEQVGTWMELNLPIIQGMMGGTGQNRANVPGYNINNGIYTPQSYQPIAPPNIANHVPIPEQTSTYTNASSFNPMPNPSQPSYGGRTRPGTDWSAEGMAGAAGSLLTRALPIAGPLAAGLAIGDLAVNSYDKYKDSGDSLSGLTKQILSTKDSLESLQGSVNGAGAAMAMQADQSARIANTLGSAYGSLSMASLSNKVSMVGGMALSYGANADTLSQGFAGAAQMGMTTGPGSTMNQGQLAFGLANSASQSGMNGRMEELMGEVLTATQSIQSTSVTSNPSTLIGIITAMNANLPRSMQGQGGADIIGKMSSSMANPNGLQQIMNYKAMSGAGVNSYFGMMRDQQMGPGFVLPNGQTNIEAMFGQYNKTFGGNPDEESYFIQQGMGLTMPQADQMMKIFGKGGTGIKSLQNNLGLTSDQISGMDGQKLALMAGLNNATSEAGLQSVEKDWAAGGGVLTDDQKKALSSGTTDQKKKLLAQDIMGGQYSTKTTTEKIDTLTATVTNAQINITGKVTSAVVNPPAGAPTVGGGLARAWGDDSKSVGDIIKGLKDFSSPSGIGGKFASGDISGALGDVLHGLESGLAGIFTAAGSSGITATSFNPQQGITSGGYGYSNAMTATTVGMNGMNNAFSWLSNKGNGQTNGIIQTSFSGGGSGGGSPSFSGSAKDFTTKMYSYAQDASQKTGLPASFIIGQWGEESGWGSSSLAKNNNNFGGIKDTSGNYVNYGSAGDFSDAYSKFLNNPRYAGARNAGSSGASASTIAGLLHQEGYAEDPNYGSKIAGAVGTEAKSMGVDISDASLSKLGTAIANAILGSGGGWKSGPYVNT